MRNRDDHAAGSSWTTTRSSPGPAAADVLAGLLEDPRFEVLPTSGTAERVATALPPGRRVTVTASPGRGLEATLDLAVELAGLGYDVTPHVAARMVRDAGHLAQIVDQLREAGIARAFVPGGDGAPVGEYHDAMSMLRELTRLGSGGGSPLSTVGVTAYPESHPTIADDLVVQAMWDKREHATEMVSNMVFDHRVVQDWLARTRRRGITLPLWLGLPGPVETARLISIATRIGVGDSARFLLKNRRTVARLARPGGFDAETFLRRLAPTLAAPGAGVAGLHLFTFNQVAETEQWRARLLSDLRAPEPPRTRRRPRRRPQHQSHPHHTDSHHTPHHTDSQPADPHPGAPR